MVPIISIIIPIYNMEKSIKTSVSSILKQTCDEYEIILVDDGSSDNSYEECIKLKKVDARISVFHTENQGSGPARNYGISKAQGEYVYFMDADDYLHANAIKKMIATIKAKSPDLIVFGFEKADNQKIRIATKKFASNAFMGTEIRKNYSAFFDSRGKYTIQGAPWNKLFRLSIIKKYNVEYPALRRHQDDAFIGRYMSFAEKIVFIKELLYTHYVNDLKTEWEKYPVNYIDSVVGLYKCRQETILTWNSKDLNTKRLVEAEFISNTIKALEMSFSPKIEMGEQDRYNWVKAIVQKQRMDELSDNAGLQKYQKVVFKLIKGHKYRLTIYILRIKVILEKIGVIYWIKKIRRLLYS